MTLNIVKYNQAFRKRLFNKKSSLVLDKVISSDSNTNTNYLPRITMSKAETDHLVLCQEIKSQDLKKMPDEKVLDDRMMTIVYHYCTLLNRDGKLEPLDLKVTVGSPFDNDHLFRKQCYLENGKLYDLQYVFDAISIHPVFRYYQKKMKINFINWELSMERNYRVAL